MSTYQTLKGLKVKFLDSATSGDRAIEGEIFYNSSGPNVAAHIAVGAWSAGSNLVDNRKNGSGFGPSTAAVFAGGQAAGGGKEVKTEEYNGSGWATSGDMSTARTQLGGITAGSQTAGLIFGGNVPPGSAPHAGESNATEEYNGTSWTNGNNMATTVTAMGGSGTQTAAFSAGGSEGGTPKNNSQEYDGTNWTNGNNINTARQTLAGMGTQTAGLVVGGEVTPPSSSPGATEEYDGTNWTAGGATNTGRHSSSGGGTQTAGLVFAGTTVSPDAVRDETEQYDGTSWTEVGDLATARTNVGGYNGPSSSGICIAGGAPSLTGATEEFNVSTSTTTAAAWASGGNLGTARDSMGVAQQGTQTAALVFGGYSGSDPGDNETEEYDGTSWAEQNNLNSARYSLAGAGIQTAALGFGGSGPSALNESYDGTSWTEVGDLNSTRGQLAGCGIQTAALAYGGQTAPSGLAVTEEWDGSSWTESGDLNTARYGFKGAGTQTAALAMGGVQSPPTISDDTEEYNGTSWTSVNDMLSPAFNHGASGLQTAALQFGGQTGSSTGGAKTAVATGYDGTSWSTRPSLATTRSQICGSSGTSNTSGLAVGGIITPAYSNHTEEFTGDTTSLGTAKTIDFD